ncbi:MAG: hypothetical protein F4090_04990 [Nitrospira sp. SB0672_bin_25]|nr:hypothetical protein [Nitrospira sp. SB0666_bin_27]MYF24257.1 hypothetical protein [Nitrospira sp. SB0678_bin_10]MYJ54249.1 hypothetical protein [Nitrospira sp. SB0672_bin_25]
MDRSMHEHEQGHPEIEEEMQIIRGEYLALLSVVISIIAALNQSQKRTILKGIDLAIAKVSDVGPSPAPAMHSSLSDLRVQLLKALKD